MYVAISAIHAPFVVFTESTATDGWKWTRWGTAFTGGVDGRDPMVLQLVNPLSTGQFIIYYTGTDPDVLEDNVTHVTYYRTSDDLLNWSDPGYL